MKNDKLKHLSEGRLDLFLSASGAITKTEAKKEASWIIHEKIPELETNIENYETEYIKCFDALDSFIKNKSTSIGLAYIKTLYGKSSIPASENYKVIDKLTSRADWLDAKIDSEYDVIKSWDKRLDELANMYAGVERKIARETRQEERKKERLSKKVLKDNIKQAKIDIETMYSRILSCEKVIADLDVKLINYTAEAEKIEPKIKDRTAISSQLRRFAELLDLIPQIDNDIVKQESTITTYNKDIDVLVSKYGKNIEGYADRKARQTARKDKRNSKRLIKDALKKNYGNGADFKKLWEKWKAEIKTEKKEIISQHGGSFVFRFSSTANKVGALAIRSAFQGLMLLNAFNISGRILKIKQEDSEKYKKIQKVWKFFGGNTDKFDNRVEKTGVLKAFPPFGAKVIPEGSKSLSAIGEDLCENSNLYLSGVEEVLAYMAVASPILASLSNLIGNITGDDETDNAINEQSKLDAYNIIDDMNISDEDKQKLKELIDSGMTIDEALEELGYNEIPNNSWLYWTLGASFLGLISIIGLVIYLTSGKKK